MLALVSNLLWWTQAVNLGENLQISLYFQPLERKNLEQLFKVFV